MQDKSAGVSVETKCVHHWKLDPPDGVKSHGVCQLCGAEYDFENWTEKTDYGKIGRMQKKKQNAPHSY